jgi:hypothetical protein
MTMNQDQIKANLLSVSFWLRLLFMVVYAVALWVVGIILTVICLLQTLIVLITGEVNNNLQRLGIHTAAYLNQIVRFMIFATEEKPFPFDAFPNGDGDVVVNSTVVTTTASVVTPADSDVAPPAEVVDDDDQSHDSYYDPERDSGATR